MTERLYYSDSFLHEFEANVKAVSGTPEAPAFILNRSAFYPASGGQNSDTGWLELPDATGSPARVRVREVAEDLEGSEVLHLIEGEGVGLHVGAPVRGIIDAERRRDHVQQHSGQHILSGAFEKLYGFSTVSFHMGDETCTIDLATGAVTPSQITAAEKLANEVIAEDRPVEIRFATADEARAMGVRKIPPAEREKLRLIDVRDFDLNACGGTHVRSTGQVGGLLLRKVEKVKQGMRIEFVCGLRAVAIARRDFQALTDAGTVFSAHIWDVPAQARKSLDEIRAAQKTQHRLLEEVAELQAAQLVQGLAGQSSASGLNVVVQFFSERDLGFIKMLAQKLMKAEKTVALLGCAGSQPAIVFAQTPGLAHDMGALMKEAVQKMGTRGGGARDMAQGGASDAGAAEQALQDAARDIVARGR